METLQPKLRFPEFEGNWTTQQLGDVGDIKMCRRIFNEETTTTGDIPFYKIGSFGKVADAFISKELYLNYRSRFSFPKKGDILISAAGTIGRTVVYNGEDAYFQDSNIVWIDNDNTITSNEFLFYVYQIVSFNTEGGTIQRLYNNILKSTKFFNPSLDEQTKIANFLSAVDEKLNLLKEKKELLQNYKKGIMQKIFNQEIRFKDDNGSDYVDWEEKTFGEMSTIRRGASPRPITDTKWFDENSTIGWVRISDVSKSNKYLLKTEQYLSEEGVNKSRLVTKGNLIMSICATIGKPIYTDFDVCIHDGFVVFENLKGYREYFYYYLQYIQKNWYNYGQPGTQVNLNSDIVSNELLLFPSIDEQTKIANFLSAVDEKIELVSNQIQDAQEYKKGLLQQMFI